MKQSISQSHEGKGSDEALPVAELMRRKNLKKKSSTETNLEKRSSEDDAVDIDDEIKRLEAELAESSSSSEDSDESDDDDDEDDGSDELSKVDQRNLGKANKEVRRKRIKFGEATVLNPEESRDTCVFVPKVSGDGIISMSECASDFIAPLPNSALPKTVSRPMKCDRPEGSKANRKRKRSKSGNGADDSQAANDGLREAVKEVLAG
eukprot:10145_1